ncbi:hypothetical protein Slin15195_G082460 [Septoria linicola]|uniref:Uncharacterized protein n=1 Tax=Septoria linicola TaxID=215465 RepID=A0A9Q9AZW4_9PEZI|nr:hypothetical protein Slin15195_G082460 [Septoria linicola]
MRHLFFWIKGKDLYEAPPVITAPDPKLQSPTQLFSYEYLLIVLAEAEGVRAGGMIAKSYMSIIAQICAVALATRKTYVPRRLLKQMRKWLEVGHELGRIHIGPKYRILTVFACPKEFLASIENDGRIRWELFFPAKGNQKC